MKTTYQTGIAGELKAAEWLRKNCGMKFDQNTIVFVEVKTRLHALPGTGLLAVDRKKQRRIARAAMLYLLSKGWQKRSCRFDVAEVSESGVLHIPNAFQPGDMFYPL